MNALAARWAASAIAKLAPRICRRQNGSGAPLATPAELGVARADSGDRRQLAGSDVRAIALRTCPLSSLGRHAGRATPKEMLGRLWRLVTAAKLRPNDPFGLWQSNALPSSAGEMSAEPTFKVSIRPNSVSRTLGFRCQTADAQGLTGRSKPGRYSVNRVTSTIRDSTTVRIRSSSVFGDARLYFA